MDNMKPKKLSVDEIKEKVLNAFEEYDLQNKKILVIIPDNTRSAPVDSKFGERDGH